MLSKKAAGLCGDLRVSSGLVVDILIWLLWSYCDSCWVVVIQFLSLVCLPGVFRFVALGAAAARCAGTCCGCSQLR